MPPSRRPDRAGPPPRGERRNWPRIGAVVAGGAAALWLVLAVTIGGIVHPAQAGRILAWSPFDARLNGAAALGIVTQASAEGRPEGMLAAAPFAERAMRRDPTNVDAIRTLALLRVLQQRPDQARRLIAYSDSLSRRDLGTRLFLIEERVQADDVEGALRHFDIALRTNANAGTMLFPVLVSAAGEEHIARRLRAMVEGNPPWRSGFFEQLIHGAADTRTVVFMIGGLLDLEDPGDRLLGQAAMNRFTRDNDLDQAWAFYDATVRSPGARTAVRHGDFSQSGALAPVDWLLAGEGSLAGLLQPRPRTSNVALAAYSQEGRAGEVARQLLRLPPGRHRFTAVAGDVPVGAAVPGVRIECATGGVLMRAGFDEVGGGRSFAVPQGCRHQWLVIDAAAIAGDAATPWIDDIAIAPVR